MTLRLALTTDGSVNPEVEEAAIWRKVHTSAACPVSFFAHRAHIAPVDSSLKYFWHGPEQMAIMGRIGKPEEE